jgi:predicted acylesterase/phospholipase RssA
MKGLPTVDAWRLGLAPNSPDLPAAPAAHARTAPLRLRNGGRRIALMPLAGSRAGTEFADALVGAFDRMGRVATLRPQKLAASHLSPGHFAEMERQHDLVACVCRPEEADWAQRSLDQADVVLLLADADTPPQALPQPLLTRPGQQVELVLLRGDGRLPRDTAAWLGRTACHQHHHARRGHAPDAARVARLLCGRATGLALSGGGRRTTAYIGVFRALQESGVEIDLIAGTSGGAMLGAMQALGWQPADMLEQVRALGRAPFYRDWALPVVSVLGGKVLDRMLQRYFGELGIEDAPTALMPVCASLVHNRMVVPAQGPLWQAVRASASLPGIFPPVPWQGDLLVDGGVINSLPADLLVPYCAGGQVIAADVSAPAPLQAPADDSAPAGRWKALWRALQRRRTGRPGLPTLPDILMRSACLASQALRRQNLAHVHRHIQPLAAGLPRARDELQAMVEAGYRETLARLAATAT